MKFLNILLFVLFSFPAFTQCPTFCPFNFTAKRIDAEILISWEVLNEDNTESYSLLRSTDGKIFNAVMIIKSENKKKYNCKDDFSETAYYQIVKNYRNGRTEKTAIVAVQGIEDTQIRVVCEGQNITFLGANGELFNYFGQMLMPIKKGDSITLSKGVYFFVTKSETKKFSVL